MLTRGFLAVLVLVASGLFAACGDGELSPFDGDWLSTTGGALHMDDTHWQDGDGDSGEYEFSGDYPNYSVLFRSDAGDVPKDAVFCDKRTFWLCDPAIAADDICRQAPATGCDQFVWDKPTIH